MGVFVGGNYSLTILTQEFRDCLSEHHGLDHSITVCKCILTQEPTVTIGSRPVNK